MAAIIEAHGLTKRFGDVDAPAGLDLVAESGQVTALLGPNGAVIALITPQTSEETMPNNIMYVTLYVTDQDQALTFYTDALGLEKRVDYPGPEGRFLTVGVPRSPVEIILWPGDPAPPQAADGVEPGTIPGPVFLESDDLRQEFEALRARGVTFEQPEPEEYPFGVRITALDPDGNRIELRQRPRSGRGEG